MRMCDELTHLGILLITSNRVGTFNEAFKLRIQLAIHYKSLTEEQRLQIWGNFLNRLATLKIDLDLDQIRRRISELASHKLNGRQIRNVITTAYDERLHSCSALLADTYTGDRSRSSRSRD